MSSIFTKIIQGEIPSYKIAENEFCYAFLDIQPLREGHTLVVPKLEVDYIFDLPGDVYNDLWSFAAEVSHAINASFKCNRVGVAVVGLEVPHAHIHLIPIDRVSDMDFSKPKLNLTKEQFQAICDKIKGNI
jgi:histidine triad (HIT) family protein